MILETAFLLGVILECGSPVHPEIVNAIIKTESGKNPFVIANVTDSESYVLESKEEAIEKANELAADGKKYSAGLMQIDSDNFPTYKITNDKIFDYCQNIKIGADIFKKCYALSKKDNEISNDHHLDKALSCYYSGNFKRGFVEEGSKKQSYVTRVKLNYSSIFQVPAWADVSYYEYETELDSKGIPQKVEDFNSSYIPAVNVDAVKREEPTSWDIFSDFSSEKNGEM